VHDPRAGRCTGHRYAGRGGAAGAGRCGGGGDPRRRCAVESGGATMNRRADLTLAAVVLALVATDWLTKLWIIRAMALGEIRTVVDGWVHFVHRQNPGVAFSMFADLPDTWRMPMLVGLSLIGIVIFSRMVLSSADEVVRGS